MTYRGALPSMPAEEFFSGYLTLEPGQHITLIGPNGVGKTTVGFRLLSLGVELNPHTYGLALVMKKDRGAKEPGQWRRPSGDETVTRLTKRYGGKIIRSYPPMFTAGRPPFYSLWPPHTGDPQIDENRHFWTFRQALLGEYNRGNSWIFADEAFGLSDELALKRELIQIWSRGRSMKCGLIASTQRAAHVPLWMYSEAKHFFLWNMRDAGAFKRIREIGNVDPHLVQTTLSRLSKHQCLYLYPDGDIWCVLT